MTKPSIIIAGVAGRMGRAILGSALEKGVTIAGAFDRPDASCAGDALSTLLSDADPAPLTGLKIADSYEAVFQKQSVLIDFTSAEASLRHASIAADGGACAVIGATGFCEDQEKAFGLLAEKTALVKAGNMSLGVNLLCALVERAAQILPEEFDIEIVEGHHRRKTDAPSGTALMMGEAAAAGRGVALRDKAVKARDGDTGPRADGDIGFAVIRGGGIIGDHDAVFAGAREVLTLSHRALDRKLFADGAVRAAQWVASRRPGLYDMRSVLGF
ncbi:MAG: 4-hydroxy-tetrahydrodipicolinate reductase [Pseudomonadota bacterium]